MDWSSFLASGLPAIVSVLCVALVISLFFLRAYRARKEAPGGFRPLLQRGAQLALIAVVLLLLAAGVLRMFQPPRGPDQGYPETKAAATFPPLHFGPEWKQARRPDGTPAPDFELRDLRDGTTIRFSRYRGSRPAVLIFGSPSCDVFCDSVHSVRRLYEQYRGKAAFVFVHVTNAVHSLPPKVREGYEKLKLKGPSQDTREARACIAVAYFDFSFPCLLDTRDEQVEKLYDAWPRRLLVIGPDGRIARDFGRGVDESWDFRAIENCLDEQLRNPRKKENNNLKS